VYGQSFIHDDHFLALVASLASIFNAIWRPLWGLLADRIGFLVNLLIIVLIDVLFFIYSALPSCELKALDIDICNTG
jgi:nitrate/nitrite transporter NarK